MEKKFKHQAKVLKVEHEKKQQQLNELNTTSHA